MLSPMNFGNLPSYPIDNKLGVDESPILFVFHALMLAGISDASGMPLDKAVAGMRLLRNDSTHDGNGHGYTDRSRGRLNMDLFGSFSVCVPFFRPIFVFSPLESARTTTVVRLPSLGSIIRSLYWPGTANPWCFVHRYGYNDVVKGYPPPV